MYATYPAFTLAPSHTGHTTPTNTGHIHKKLVVGGGALTGVVHPTTETSLQILVPLNFLCCCSFRAQIYDSYQPVDPGTSYIINTKETLQL